MICVACNKKFGDEIPVLIPTMQNPEETVPIHLQCYLDRIPLPLQKATLKALGFEERK